MKPRDFLLFALTLFVVFASLALIIPAIARGATTSPAIVRAAPFAPWAAEIAGAIGKLLELAVLALGALLLKWAGKWIGDDLRAKASQRLEALAGMAAAYAEEWAAARLKRDVATSAGEKLAAAKTWLRREAREKGLALVEAKAGELIEGMLPFVGLGASAKASPDSEE